MVLLIAILIAILPSFGLQIDHSNHCESCSSMFKPGVEFYMTMNHKMEYILVAVSQGLVRSI